MKLSKIRRSRLEKMLEEYKEMPNIANQERIVGTLVGYIKQGYNVHKYVFKYNRIQEQIKNEKV